MDGSHALCAALHCSPDQPCLGHLLKAIIALRACSQLFVSIVCCLLQCLFCAVQPELNQAGSCWCLVCVQDIERGAVDTQLIAHDREVYDIAWGGVGVFATVSADGSVRVFDLRCDGTSHTLWDLTHL